MNASYDGVRSLDELRALVHRKLCEKENLLPEMFTLSEMQLTRKSRPCGLQFSLHGPRNVRLGAIWASDHNVVYLYDAHGVRFEKLRLKQRLHETGDSPDPSTAGLSAA